MTTRAFTTGNTSSAFLGWLFTDFDFHNNERLQCLQTYRAAGRMPAVFRFATDGESKNPVINQTLGLLCRGKVLSFAYFSLHEQRKVGRASARKRLILPLNETFEQTQT
jgi:hypothetical protein